MDTNLTSQLTLPEAEMINDAWFDWFCEDNELQKRGKELRAALLEVLEVMPHLDLSKHYVFFKNNCPLYGKLYDSFSIVSCDNRNVVLWVTKRNGHDGPRAGKAEVVFIQSDRKYAGSWAGAVEFIKQG